MVFDVYYNVLLIYFFCISYLYVYEFVICIIFESSVKVFLKFCILDFVYLI